MNHNRVKGMIDEVVGSAKRNAGRITDDPRLQIEGMVQQAKGRLEQTWGKAKDAITEVIYSTESLPALQDHPRKKEATEETVSGDFK